MEISHYYGSIQFVEHFNEFTLLQILAGVTINEYHFSTYAQAFNSAGLLLTRSLVGTRIDLNFKGETLVYFVVEDPEGS